LLRKNKLTNDKEKNSMVSLKNFVEDVRKEKRQKQERSLVAFTMALSAIFIILSIYVSTL
jgi:hypothetical protein